MQVYGGPGGGITRGGPSPPPHVCNAHINRLMDLLHTVKPLIYYQKPGVNRLVNPVVIPLTNHVHTAWPTASVGSLQIKLGLSEWDKFIQMVSAKWVLEPKQISINTERRRENIT